MAYDVASLTESLTSILFARYMANAVDCEMDITAQTLKIVHDVKYYHSDVPKDVFLGVLRRNIEQLKTVFMDVYMETADILCIIAEVDTIYEGV